jgi:hypothetical protein
MKEFKFFNDMTDSSFTLIANNPQEALEKINVIFSENSSKLKFQSSKEIKANGNKVENNFIDLIEMNKYGEVIRLNEANGKIHIAKKGGSMGVIGSNTTVANVLYLISKGSKIDKWFLTPFRKWQKEFASANPEKYNKLINMELTI